ncbi:MAG: 3-deoxy-7-phosphoheptulonate synthase [Firmicutes bacterium HGW-Firmicutes-13]|nr:MAG: 3-deoxy-7-phosphoheptulonate synthase [Firmicutes bacterium HGW-Firmicutes-13]
MIVVMKLDASPQEVCAVKSRLENLGFKIHTIQGVKKLVLGAVGDRRIISSLNLESYPGVEKVVPIMKPFKMVSREVKEESSIIRVGEVEIGGPNIVIMAGPCAVESEEQVMTVAKWVKESGGQILRGGAFKPRTSPYSFQGLEEEGLKILARAREETGLPIVTEVINPQDVELVASYADILQVGSRNMQNFALLKAVGMTGKPVLLKRGLSATIEEWLMAAEYIIAEDNYNIILCERGIRTYETYTRYTLDISAVPVVKSLSHLPVIVDPCHSSGNWRLVAPLSKASIAAGADGLLIEVHPNPPEALCDGQQSLSPKNYQRLISELRPFIKVVGRNYERSVSSA